MSDTALDVQVDARGVAFVTLDRPDVLNAFDEALIAEISRAFLILEARAEVRAIVLGARGRVFCAGADIAWMRRAAANSREDNLVDARRFAGMMHAIHSSTKPVVARVQGGAYGGGVGLVCAADIVIAADHATFSVSEAKLGILPAVIGPYLTDAVGLRQARRLALSAASITAAEALAIGLVHEVVPEPQLDAAIEKTLGDLLRCGPQAQAEIKKLFGTFGVGPISEDVRERTARTIANVRAGTEAKEGFSAFVDKRKPAWTVSGE
ncbi:enoyl-CoA hydratase-related protein [Pararobbsia silviterrae]|uniref:Enoyl-CoA hydratase/isomerase family protein n=1 Tax=Pararobbsia silviterrae TaxID=1792498 RepID=A0A494Y1I3_9BURK|nr:enoyl-CoA hydratase-related protein [Pararobbsia silviterrae]RKP55868.1 enoyl-CoA hydratase/isomerase family protein [Pararobbsia silviterrae]